MVCMQPLECNLQCSQSQLHQQLICLCPSSCIHCFFKKNALVLFQSWPVPQKLYPKGIHVMADQKLLEPDHVLCQSCMRSAWRS